MGLARIWTCDKCGQVKQMDSTEESVKPPHGWQTIPFAVKSSMRFVLLCPDCMNHVYVGFIEDKAVAGDAAYRRGVLETLDELANYLDNPELRKIHSFVLERQEQLPSFEPGKVLLAWVNDPGPEIVKELANG